MSKSVVALTADDSPDIKAIDPYKDPWQCTE